MELTLLDKYELIKENVNKESGINPIEIVRNIMHMDFISIHGPEHHFLDGASLMRAMFNAGLKFNYDKSLELLKERAIKMPGAMCGYWGICGSVASIGAVFAIIDGTGPLSNDENYMEHMAFTSSAIEKMSKIGGPRCCKRNAFLSISEGIKYANSHYGLKILLDEKIFCEFSNRNSQCILNRCPFHA